MANYFNTLLRDITYNSYIQAIFNFPFEWMNLFCCWCKDPKECIKEIDIKFCICDSFFLTLFQVLLYLLLIITVLALSFFAALLGGNKKEKENNDD